MTELVRDHKGKLSQGRVAALAGTVTACTLACAPLWGGPETSIEVIAMFLGLPGGLVLWQKGAVERAKDD